MNKYNELNEIYNSIMTLCKYIPMLIAREDNKSYVCIEYAALHLLQDKFWNKWQKYETKSAKRALDLSIKNTNIVNEYARVKSLVLEYLDK